MTILVTQLKRKGSKSWAHIFSDDIDELGIVCEMIGLERSNIVGTTYEHADVNEEQWQEVVDMGAKVVSADIQYR